ncbi:transglutaminase family protein [Roseococcus pinisoli]|uniref:Transglutaminase family protein n=1 Tax=Roseococcus pinisoli TaxID=2835040 RepID=A0ABS5QD16_9PROT|nr:transglutaminase family protein [Roseococcus pinisoli]MBS7811590.1 transglutaminase family protein [Roseococcus pinisoli]
MSIHVALTHKTSYSYDRAVTLGPQTIRLRPAPHARTPVLAYSLKVEPRPNFINWQQDPQGNFQARVVFPERVTRFEVTVDLVADMAAINPFDFFLEPEAEHYPFAYDPVLDQELAPFRRLEPTGPLLQALLAQIPRHRQRVVDMLVAVNQLVQSRIAYIVRLEPGVWEPEHTLNEGRGSCRDSAWLLVQALRHLGLAARFCSGYLIQLVADQKPVDGGAEGPTTDFTDLHAWAEVYLPGAGWVGLDATSGMMAGEGHIPLAATPEPQSAAPISGLVEKAETEFGFEMTVTRLRETPRVTKPYAPAVWEAIEAAGTRVDEAIRAQDMRLTMGGEPTFVAAADPDAAEWNTDALGPTKRAYAGRLLRRLLPLWAKGAALHTGQGKQYPGEPLPRFALSAHWRTDGEAVWRNPALLASDDDEGRATAAEAEAFGKGLAQRLQVPAELLRPAHEDVHYYLWREGRLPANVVAEESRLGDPLERARFARLYREGLAGAVGWVLPLHRVARAGERRWQSGRWFLREDTLFLTPGDAPMGLRLPLASLPWIDPAERAKEAQPEPDPFTKETEGPLPTREQLRPVPPIVKDIAGAQRQLSPAAPPAAKEDPVSPRTALCVEPRGGHIHVFFPPLTHLEDWLSLVAAVEDTAEATGQKVILEGYPPPEDPRLPSFSVTPDPGVIEVNVHPAHSWPQMVERTGQLYEEARQIGLATEKFMLDGRHVGTGGGNHVVMGAARAEDSPFLRRPDLLRSLVSFWHNHPSLSFLFSGLFIGPTSQHPRVDEARMDALRELEIAFGELDRVEGTPPPWMTDRLFRNLLADMTGNTHRTEFCIDKMYDPGSSSGRRGLVEFRAFEMPPHPQMSLAQMLLMRSALAAFWKAPYRRPLTRWGTSLHDRFMLPHHVAEDFFGALEELGQLGFPLEREWFAPHLEFRFPQIGQISLGSMEVELRAALEPWHVLGEEQTSGGTVRYVDSSIERVQAKVTNWVPERFLLAANGVAVPLQPTGRAGEFVAGIRFKAWDPPSALHPTIRAQGPLILDVHDRWSGRSLGGLTHEVVHPGGMAYDSFPVNANAAEARRRSRFIPFGHRAGPQSLAEPERSLEHPCTLDLRAFAGQARHDD